MPDYRRLSLIVGLFVLAALGTLAVAILSLSSQQGVWAERYTLLAYYDNVGGLIPNAPVWLAGTQVGRVGAVDLGAEPNGEPAVVVVLQIDQTVQPRIRADSVASIGTIGLLGDRYVEVSLGTPAAPVLEDGARIRSVDPVNMAAVVDQGAAALDSVAALAANLNQVVEEFGGNAGGRGLAKSVQAVAEIVEQIQEGEGLLHSLIYDEYEGGGVQSIDRALATLEQILTEVAEGDGVLHSLIYDELTEQDVVLEALEAGSRLNSILSKVDRGEGTVGLLVNDPTLYEDLKQLLGGAQRSALVRTLIRLSTDDEN